MSESFVPVARTFLESEKWLAIMKRVRALSGLAGSASRDLPASVMAPLR